MTRRVKARACASLVVLSLAATGTSAGVAHAAAAPAHCRMLDLSPAFATDGTAFCAATGGTRHVVYRTTDRGRSWTRVGADSPWIPDQSAVTQVVVSATYAADRTVYLLTTSTLYMSEDAGNSFLPVDLFSGDNSGRRILTPYVDSATGLAYLAFAKYESPARLRPPAREPVNAALPAKTDRFLLPVNVTETSDPLLLAFDGRGESLTSTVFGCTARLDCQDRRGSFRWTARGAWRSPRYATDRTLYFATPANGFTFLRSTDGGRTIKPFTSLNAALAPITTVMTKKGLPQFWPASMAFGPNGRIYVRVVSGLADDGTSPPNQVILRSDDNGVRWKQVATQYAPGGRRRGNLPFEVVPHTTYENATQLVAAPDGRLFAMGDGYREDDTGPWCSVDGGVRWYRVCPR